MAPLELKIPPPLVAVAIASAMYVAASLLPPVLALAPGVRVFVALVLAGGGGCFFMVGLLSF